MSIVATEIANPASIFRTSPKRGTEISEEQFPYHHTKDEAMTMRSMTEASSASSTEDYDEAHPVSPALDNASDMNGYRLEVDKDTTSVPPPPSPASDRLKESILNLKSKINDMVHHWLRRKHRDICI